MGFLFDKPDPPDPPDFTPFLEGAKATAASDAEAARINAELGREQLAKQDIYAGRAADLADKYFAMAQDQVGFGKAQYNQMLPYLQRYMDSQVGIAEGSAQNMQEQLAGARQSRE